MSLRNDKDNMVFNLNEPTSEALFAESERRLSAKKQIIADLQNEYRLLEEQAFNQYKNHVSYWNFQPSFIDDVNKWLKMVADNKDDDGNKLDRRKKYKEKDVYEYMNKYLSGLLGYEVKISAVVYYGWASEGYNLEFDLQGRKWVLFVPAPDKVTMKTFQFDGGNFFKLKLYEYDKEYHRSLWGSTFRENDLKEIMTKALGGESSEDTSDDN